MNEDDVIRFRPHYPSSAGGIQGGRATFYDTRSKGNTFLGCPDYIRSYAFGMHYDEIDISRSHISSVIGCWLLTRRPRSISCLRILDDRDAFEAEITADLDSARAHLTAIVNQHITLSAGVPTKPLSQLLTSARTWLDRTHLKPKTVY